MFYFSRPSFEHLGLGGTKGKRHTHISGKFEKDVCQLVEAFVNSNHHKFLKFYSKPSARNKRCEEQEMSFHNNDSFRIEDKTLSAAAEDDGSFMEIIKSLALLESPGVSRNIEADTEDLDPKTGYNNTCSHENFTPKLLADTATNTSITSFSLYRKESTEFTTWPKRRMKHQGGRLVGDKGVNAAMYVTSESKTPAGTSDAVPDSAHSSETLRRYVTRAEKMECISTGPLCNLAEEFNSNCGNLFGNTAIPSTSTDTQMLASNTESSAGITKHILDLPDLVLEHILGYVDLNDLSEKVRPVCRTFYAISSRILRLAFKSIHTRISSTLHNLENQHPSNWNPICAEVLTCKLLQSEMDTLRAACSRQIESGHFCFIHGDVLQEYLNIIRTVQDGKINVMLDGFSDTLIKLNEKPLKYWDSRYDDEDMLLGEMKLLGVEIIEILLSALNASGCIVVTYQPSFTSASSSEDKQGDDASGSCMMAGCISINWSTELKPPPIDHVSVKAQRRAILRYIRSLVRANNCDIVLYKLRAYSKEKEASLPMFEHRTWTLCKSKVMHNNMVQESYGYAVFGTVLIHDNAKPYIAAVIRQVLIQFHYSVSASWMQPRSNAYFELICPKRVNPFGIVLNRMDYSPPPSEVVISEQKDTHTSNLAESLSGDHYIFKMDFKTWTPGSSQEHTIEIENYVTKTNNWILNINTNSPLAE